MDQKLAPIHRGEVLREEDIAVPPRRINEIVQGQRSVTADTFFGTSDMFWLNLQARYDLDVQKQRLGKRASALRRKAK